MTEPIEKIAGTLGSIVGAENVRENPGVRIDNHEPSVLVLPGSAQEVAHCLRVCSEGQLSVIPAGSMTWLDGGNPLRRADILISLRRMARIIDYSPPDLTVSVEAGTSLAELNSAALEEGQWLPLDPPGYSDASMGAIVACASSGALRFGFGTPRDYVIGLRLAHIEGALSKSGGRVVKNVAGYDMNKLYVGSFGTLGVIAEATFKLRPRPDTFTTLVIEDERRERLETLAGTLLAEGLQPASLILTVEQEDGSKAEYRFGHALFVRFIDGEAAVRHQVARALELSGRNASILSEADQERVWKGLADLERFGKTLVRISSPISKTRALLEATIATGSTRFVEADLATGIIRVALQVEDNLAAECIERLRSNAHKLGGALFIERADPSVRERASAWDDLGATAGLMSSIKAKFDPRGLLNPGRFAGGI